MQKKFTVLRIIGTIWKILAWIELVVGVLSAVGVLLAGVFGGLSMTHYVPVPRWPSRAYGAASGILGFVAVLIATVVWFLVLYAGGELVYLFLAIEENTRRASEQIEWLSQGPARAEPAYEPPPSFSPPPPPPAPAPAPEGMDRPSSDSGG